MAYCEKMGERQMIFLSTTYDHQKNLEPVLAEMEARLVECKKMAWRHAAQFNQAGFK